MTNVLLRRLALLLSVPLICSCALIPSNYVSLHDRTALGIDEIAGKIADHRIIFIGEGHDQMEDHLVQRELIRRLQEKGKKIVLALEMFPTAKQPFLDRWNRRELTLKEFVAGYYSSWSVSFDYYEDIFTYARDNGIHLAGINADKDLIGRVAKGGIAVVDKGLLKRVSFRPCSEDPEYMKVMGYYVGRMDHAAGLAHMCDAQLLRDTVMAYSIASLAGQGEFTTVVVIAGSAHASKIAVPRLIRRYADIDPVVLVSSDFSILTGSEISEAVADFIWE